MKHLPTIQSRAAFLFAAVLILSAASVRMTRAADREVEKDKKRVKMAVKVVDIYDDVKLDCGFRADLVVNGLVVVELKAKSDIHPVDKAQTLSHLRLLKLRFGLLMNFHEERLVDGVHRIVNGY